MCLSVLKLIKIENQTENFELLYKYIYEAFLSLCIKLCSVRDFMYKKSFKVLPGDMKNCV